MTPEQKAKELVEKFMPFAWKSENKGVNHAKQCALICVEEICALMFDNGSSPEFTKEYWQSVKSEIDKLSVQ